MIQEKMKEFDDGIIVYAWDFYKTCENCRFDTMVDIIQHPSLSSNVDTLQKACLACYKHLFDNKRLDLYIQVFYSDDNLSIENRERAQVDEQNVQ